MRSSVIIKLEYDPEKIGKTLTGKQIAAYFENLNQLLTKLNENQSPEIEIEKGSIISVIEKIGEPIIYTALVFAALRGISADYLIIRNNLNEIFHGNTIAIGTRKDDRDQYDYTYNLDRKNIEEIPEDRIEESVEMLTMEIISAEIKKTETQDQNASNEKINKITAIAKFKDQRYSQKDPVNVIFPKDYKGAKRLANKEFIADGILTNDRGKYVKFIITEIKVPPKAINTPNQINQNRKLNF